MRSIEVTIDDRWFLPVPNATGERPEWAKQAVAALNIEEGVDESTDVGQALLGISELADPEAVANLVFCPDGLPGRAIVSVYGTETGLDQLDELVDEAPASLPRQVLPFGEHDPSTARVISTLRHLPDGLAVGVLQFQLLRDGTLIETIVTSPSLQHLGAGMPLFEELTSRVTVTASANAAE